MKINFKGQISNTKTIRIGFIGCGSHSFRNIYPIFQFVPVELISVCDLSIDKAELFKKQFGATNAYSNYKEMIKKEKLDAVFIVTGYDKHGRPLYPEICINCLNEGCHVWLEKPPAATTEDIVKIKTVAEKCKKNVLIGFKKMFMPALRKAKELINHPDFGKVTLLQIQYPQYIPTVSEFKVWEKGVSNAVVGFLDHLCHPVSALIYLAGMPSKLFYQRSSTGAGIAVFGYDNGKTASITFTNESAINCGMERTLIVSDKSRSIVVDNNIRVFYHRNPPLGYGDNPDFYKGQPDEISSIWEPEFSLGQLYNKGLFLLGYYNEINDFVNSILNNEKNLIGNLDDAWKITRIFEAFKEGPEKLIKISNLL
ncbi:MAG TPA: Gfo/Idh/MocA family oxidoreductase [Victivallales bacterium]|nr:Gfo/Idh/MocA family oxidoreductase [Victivallales bacterium]HPO90217.1 Gfo/Idh/MocA family oxidoreductase [Victivallales bacterium]HRU00949.1 Gfo/Idh/MocA family oxidoreductase [Victivallales bacterium]